MSQFAYTFDGADTAVGSGVPAPAGLPPLVAYSGSWRRLANRAFSDTAHASRPMLGLDPGGNGNFDLSAKVSPDGGDALYARWINSANWLCARVRRYQVTTSGSYYVPPTYATEYQYFANSGTGVFDHTHSSELIWSRTPPVPASSSYNHLHGGTAGASFAPVNHSHSLSYSYTGNTRQVETAPGYTQTTSSTTTYYEVILEKSVSGTVTTLGTVTTTAGLAKIRLRGIGSDLTLYLNDSATANLSRTDSAHLTATKHGIGRGPSELSGTALDDLFLDNLNSPPNAPTITLPAAVDLTQPLIVNVQLNDEPGDSALESFLRHRHPATSATWTVIKRTSSNTNVTIPADSLIDGQNEVQGASRDAQGLPVGDANLVWSASQFVEAGTPPAGLSFVDPLAGATIPTSSYQYVVSLGGSSLTALEWRVLGDLAGAPDPGNVINPGATINDPAATTFLATGLPDGQLVHAQVRGYDGLLVGDWVTRANVVAFSPPPDPSLVITTAPRLIAIRVVNPASTGGEPQVSSNHIWIRVKGRPGTAMLRAVVGPGGIFVWRQFASGIDYEYLVEALGENGTSAVSDWQLIVPAVPLESVYDPSAFDPAVFG